MITDREGTGDARRNEDGQVDIAQVEEGDDPAAWSQYFPWSLAGAA